MRLRLKIVVMRGRIGNCVYRCTVRYMVCAKPHFSVITLQRRVHHLCQNQRLTALKRLETLSHSGNQYPGLPTGWYVCVGGESLHGCSAKARNYFCNRQLH